MSTAFIIARLPKTPQRLPLPCKTDGDQQFSLVFSRSISSIGRIAVNVLTANIQREWLARIVAGSKKTEYRDATEYWLTRLWKAGPPPFQLRLINGMKPDSPEATVLVDKVDIDLLAASIRFHIRKVQFTTRWNKSWERLYPPIPSKPPFDPTDLLRRNLKPAKVTIQVPEAVWKAASKAGTHHFIFTADEALAHKLNKQGREPFRIKLAYGRSSAEAIAYELFWELFKKKLTASVVTT